MPTARLEPATQWAEYGHPATMLSLLNDNLDSICDYLLLQNHRRPPNHYHCPHQNQRHFHYIWLKENDYENISNYGKGTCDREEDDGNGADDNNNINNNNKYNRNKTIICGQQRTVV